MSGIEQKIEQNNKLRAVRIDTEEVSLQLKLFNCSQIAAGWRKNSMK